MRTLKFIIVCFCFIIHSVIGQGATIDIISYNIKANCDLNKRLIYITVNLQIEKAVNENSFKLLLGSWSKINSIKSGAKSIEYSRKSPDDDTLFISIPLQFKNAKKINLSFDYTLILDSLDFKNKDIIFMQRVTLWHPLQYDDIASMKLYIIAPNNYSVFSTGNLINKKNVNNNIEYSYENNQNDRNAIFIFKSDTISTTLTKNIENIKINFFFVSKDTIANNKIINEVCNSFSFYNKYIGSYKYNQLNIVEIPHPQMMYAQALSSLILIGSPFLKAYKLDGNWPVHEVAHLWWGCSIFFNSKAKGRLFLEESVNEFFKILFTENTCSNDSLKSLFKSYQELYSNIDKTKELPILEITNQSTMENGYIINQKGPMVVNKFRNLMGNELYKKFIQEIYNSYYGKLLSYDDFIKTLSTFDTKGNLISTLNKWLTETGFKE